MKAPGKESQISQINFTKRTWETTVRVEGTVAAFEGKRQNPAGFQEGGVSNLQDGPADEPTWGEQIEYRPSEKKNYEVQKCIVYHNFNITSLSLKYLLRSMIAGMLPQVHYKHYEV